MNMQLKTDPTKRGDIDKYRASISQRGLTSLRVYIPENKAVEFRIKAMNFRNILRIERGETPIDLESRIRKYPLSPDDCGMVSVRVYIPVEDKPGMLEWAQKMRENHRKRS